MNKKKIKLIDAMKENNNSDLGDIIYPFPAVIIICGHLYTSLTLGRIWLDLIFLSPFCNDQFYNYGYFVLNTGSDNNKFWAGDLAEW